MYKFILEPFFINLGAATTFYDSKLQDNSNLLGVGFTLHISNMLPQESQVSFGPDSTYYVYDFMSYFMSKYILEPTVHHSWCCYNLFWFKVLRQFRFAWR